MRDPFDRTVNSLRISVTQSCNLGCFYCHREGQTGTKDSMSPKEIESLIEVAAELGIRKVKITGGEPLLRSDIVEIVRRIATHVDEVSMTTNGTLLARLAHELHRNGLKRVNISLDSLSLVTSESISGYNRLHETLQGVRGATNSGLGVKLNVVMLRGMNIEELKRLMEFSGENGATLQLIELTTERFNTNSDFYKKYHYDMENLERYFHSNALDIVFNELHKRKKYLVPLDNGAHENPDMQRVCTVELVRSMHNTEFCANCSRLRVTSDGKLKPCLLTNDGLVDVLDALRNNGGTDILKSRFMKAVSNRRPYWGREDDIENKIEVLCPL
jgi:cyclic pyranopterin phosphate synthase